MGWNRIDETELSVGRPVLVLTLEVDKPTIAFLGPGAVWYAGGALVQSSATILGATPTEWREPEGDQSL